MIKLTANVDQDNHNVDVDNKIITSVILAQVGEAQGHGVHVDQDFLNDLVDYCEKELNKIPCNFDHPKGFTGTHDLGSQVGYICNVTIKEDMVIGDLHFYEAANESPMFPKMVDYVISQAMEDKFSINLSIGFSHKGYFQIDIKTKEKTEVFDFIDNAPYPEENIYIVFDKLHYCDVVTKGAVTDSLFSANVEPVIQYAPSPDVTKFQDLEFQVTTFKNKIVELEETIQNKVKEIDELEEQFRKMKSEYEKEIYRLEAIPADEHTPDCPDPNLQFDNRNNFEKSLDRDPLHQRALKLHRGITKSN